MAGVGNIDVVVYALLNGKVSVVAKNTADAYEEKTYSVGSLVVYENKLYKCINAVILPEPFDASKWEEVKVDALLQNKADLVNGKVPLNELSGYIPETEEVVTYNDLPNPGETDMLYITLDDMKSYRWTGSTYVEVGDRNTYYSVPIQNMSTMGELRNYIDSINSQGLHCFFDFSSYVVNAYVCTVLMFTQNNINYCLIFDIMNGRTYINYSGYQDSDTIQNYVDRNEDNLIRAIKITDTNTTLGDINDILSGVNTVSHHVMFDVSALNAGAYLCTILTDGSTSFKVMDIVSQKVNSVVYNADTTLLSVLQGMKNLGLEEGSFNVINASDIVNNTLTQAQYDLITNGKLTLIKGTFNQRKNIIFFGGYEGSTYFEGMYYVIYATNGQYGLGSLKINKTSKVVQVSNLKTRFSYDYQYIESVAFFNGKTIDYYLNNVYPYATNSTTQIEYETINNISISADTTFTLAIAPANTYPEYKANIENTSSSAIVLTFTGVNKINTNDSNITIVNNTLTLPGNTTIEVNIFNNNLLAYNWNI